MNKRPFQGGKGDTWEGGLRVPAILKLPIAAAEESCSTREPIRDPVSALDFLPTVLDYAGIDMQQGVAYDGVSLRPFIEEAGTVPDRYLYHWRERSLYAVR